MLHRRAAEILARLDGYQRDQLAARIFQIAGDIDGADLVNRPLVDRDTHLESLRDARDDRLADMDVQVAVVIVE